MGFKKITEERGNYLVGFHDIDPWSSDGNNFLALRVGSMEEIPATNTYAEIVSVNLDSGAVKVLDRTICWNFPQGGRQSWIRSEDGDTVVFNVLKDGQFIAKIIDSDGQLIRYCDKPIYRVSPCQMFSYGLNYERMYRLGGYGYAGVKDQSAGDHAPQNEGIWKTNLNTGQSELLITLSEIAALQGNSLVINDTDHYVTHILPSPNGSSVCFLHRYWLPDGGIQTRLIVCGNDGGDAEVWDEGFLSHFDWIDNESILVWGKPASKVQVLRSSIYLQKIPLLPSFLQLIKPVVKTLLGRKIVPQGFYRAVSSKDRFTSRKFSENLPVEDGHPSFCPSDRSLLLTDTYPNRDLFRRLMILNCKTGQLHMLGELRQSNKKPSEEAMKAVMPFIDKNVLKKFSKKHFIYSRSGVHCDLHPRWNSDGDYFAIDSNHEGQRNVYIMELHEGFTRC